MNENTKNAFRQLAQLTCSKCEQCPVSETYRCCDAMFCGFVEQDLKRKGLIFGKPNKGGIPYMREKGCVVPPEHRPYCTGFVCWPHFKDKEFREKYDQLIIKINADPGAPPIKSILKNVLNKMGKK